MHDASLAGVSSGQSWVSLGTIWDQFGITMGSLWDQAD